MSDLNGKTAIITGGASGIGKAAVLKFIEEGSNVVIADINFEAAEDLANELNSKEEGKALAVKVDVSSFDSVEKLISSAVDKFGSIDIMFNNAGIGGGKPLLEHDPVEDYDRMIDINQKGVYYGILAAARQYTKQDTEGVIINTSSIYGYSAADVAFTYGAAKAAVIQMTKNAAFDLAKYGIRVVAIAPGRVETPIISDAFTKEQIDVFASEQLRNKMTDPKEIADVVAFLGSDKSRAINGTLIHVEDGYSTFKNRQ